MRSATLSDQSGQLSYQVYNPGKQKVFVCYHGFGLGPGMFAEMANKHTDYTFICPALPGHGTKVNVSRKRYAEVFNSWIDEQINSVGAKEINLAGFSLGARYALSTWNHMEQKIHQVYLMAPAGLVNNLWFNMATGTSTRRKLFKIVMNSPRLLKTIVSAANFLHLLPNATYQEALKFIENNKMRSLIFDAWEGASNFMTGRSRFIELTRTCPMPVQIILAKEDAFIPEKKIVQLISSMVNIELKKSSLKHNALAQFDFLDAG